MSLPKRVRPEYSTTIPSTGKKIKYQPFSVREEKVLMLAAESEDNDEIANAVSNVLMACVTSPADFNVDELALFDIEFLFLKARARSAGETVKVLVTDPNDETYSTEHEINIDKIAVQKNAEHTDLIDLGDAKIKMKYPGIDFFAEGVSVDTIAASVKTLSKCILQIVIGDEVYNKGDMVDGEIEEWLEGLTAEEFKTVMSFFDTMPKLAHKITLKNTKTGKNFTVTLEGLRDFF